MSVALPVFKNKWVSILLALLLVIIIALGTLNLDRYAQKLTQIAAYKARPLGIELSFENPRLGAISLSSDRVGVIFQQTLFSLLLNSAQLSLNPSSLFLLNPEIQFSGDTYGGKITGRTSLGGLTSSPRVTLWGYSIEIGQHPQVAAFGIEGQLNITDSWFEINPSIAPQAELHMTIINGKKPDVTSLNLEPFGAPFKITLPAIPWFSLGIDGKATGTKVEDLEFSFTSSLGSINGTGTLWLSSRKRIERVSLKVAVALTADGQREFGTIISLASAGQITNKTTEFKASFEGPAMRPNITYSDIQ